MIRTLGWTLVHFLWQGAAIASLVACLTLALRRATPQARYLAACFGLLLMLAAPPLTFRALGVASDEAPSAAPAPVLPTPEVAALPEPAPRVVAESASSASIGGGVEPLLPGLVLLWGAGVVTLCVRSIGGFALVRRLRRAGLSAPPAGLEATLERLAARLAVRRAVRLYESALVGVPTVVGWLRPAILVPASALTGLTAHQLELILAHELAHVRRHDYLVNLVQSVAETLLFYHPAVWWVSSRMRVEREHCCDDLAVAACGSAVRYARALVELEGLCAEAPALAMAANGGSLVDRIARLVGRADEPSRAARGLAAALAVASLATAVAAGSILLDRPAPTIVDLHAATEPFGVSPTGAEPALLATPAAHAAAPAGAFQPVAAAAPMQAATPAGAAQAAPAKPRPVGEPQARAFPLDRVLEMARSGITPEYIDAMDALGYSSLGAEQLIALRNQGVSPDYVRELRALGYEDLSSEDLIGLRSQGVSADFVKGLTEQGLQELSLSNLLSLRSQGVSPQYVAELKQAGQTDLSVTTLLSLRSQGVSGRYVSELKALGYGTLSHNQLVALRSQGVSPDYVKELMALGYKELDPKMLIALRSQGVGPDYVRELKELGYDGLSVGQLIELRSQGVTPDYVRELEEAGFDKLTAEELRSQGVSARLLKKLRTRS
jgi:beta-lactamase regulating signal transducer with metallopeptidase domain